MASTRGQQSVSKFTAKGPKAFQKESFGHRGGTRGGGNVHFHLVKRAGDRGTGHKRARVRWTPRSTLPRVALRRIQYFRAKQEYVMANSIFLHGSLAWDWGAAEGHDREI